MSGIEDGLRWCKERSATLEAERDAYEDVAHGMSSDLTTVGEERDALAAHVERIRSEWDELTDYASYETLLDTMGNLFSDTPTTSLARLRAEWQAEALESLLGWPLTTEAVEAEIQRLRQAKETPS